MAIVYLLVLLFLSFVLIRSADLVVIAIKRISRKTKTKIFALSVVILSLGTTLPELFVSITSALEGVSNLSLGVVIGSNIANISLIVGIAAFFTGSVHIHGDYLKKDVAIAFVAGFFPFIFVLDGTLSRVDGMILLAIYGIYTSSLFRPRLEEIARGMSDEITIHKFLRTITHFADKETRDFARLFLGIAFLLISADLIVNVAQRLAIMVNIPVFIVGLLILAVGTSLPELAFCFRSLEDKSPSMFFGNLLGSTITNSTLIIGLVAVINPVVINDLKIYLIVTISFAFVFLIFWLFIRSKHRLDRWEAFFLILLYAVFVIMEFL